MFVPYNYDDAVRWLANSKRVVDRGVRRTMYSGYYRAALVRRSPDTIGVSVPWAPNDLMVYHSDNTAVLHATVNSWNYNILRSQGNRLFLSRLAGFTNIYQKNYKFYILEQDYKVTPSKIQGCRTCSSSGKVDTMCWQPTCYEANRTLNGRCTIHPTAQIVNSYGWHYLPCEHGKDHNHKLYKSQNCYYCNGSGKREYGLKPIGLMWDGSPIRIKNGNLIKREPSELEKRIAAYVKMAD